MDTVETQCFKVGDSNLSVIRDLNQQTAAYEAGEVPIDMCPCGHGARMETCVYIIWTGGRLLVIQFHRR
jgi:hypothetical protein